MVNTLKVRQELLIEVVVAELAKEEQIIIRELAHQE
jgi:hypothetical protein